jgi:hypothetical protein
VATPPPELPGDFNHNGVVDGADYVRWRDLLGTVYTQADYDVWRANFGNTAGVGSAESVPEPAFIWLSLVGLFALVPCWRTTVAPTKRN